MNAQTASANQQPNERPILFNRPMLRAIREGRKTQTRRPLDPQPYHDAGSPYRGPRAAPDGWFAIPKSLQADALARCPYATAGDRLWVRETFLIDHYQFYPRGPLPKEKPAGLAGQILYAVDGTCCEQLGECDCEGKGVTWRSAIHMIRLVGDWGFDVELELGKDAGPHRTAKLAFANLWDSINAARGFGWNANPWVWVIEFRKCETDNHFAAVPIRAPKPTPL